MSWSGGAVRIGQTMTRPKAEHWCFEFCGVMFRNTLIEETRTNSVNYNDNNGVGGEKKLNGHFDYTCESRQCILGPWATIKGSYGPSWYVGPPGPNPSFVA